MGFIFGLLLFLLFVIFPIWVIGRINSLSERLRLQREQSNELQTELREVRAKLEQLSSLRTVSASQPVESVLPVSPTPEPVPTIPDVVREPAPAAPLTAVPEPSQVRSTSLPPDPMVEIPPAVEPPTPPPIPPSYDPAPVLLAADVSAQPAPTAEVEPPALPVPSPEPEPSPRREPMIPAINWEQFMGAKLFAWLGGLAALLAVGFFVKYSFDHDLIPPAVRVAIGFLISIGLVIGGLRIDRVRYAITAQTLIATGIVCLYTVTFACRSIYHFESFGPVPTFLLMVLITAAAFLLAVRLDAQVIAILGMLGGFLTPVLVGSGQDNPLGLFGYIALLDLGLVAVALHRRWHYLVPLGAVGTVAMQIGWAGKFFNVEKAGIAIVVCLGFAALFLGATIFARRRDCSAPEFTWSAVAMAAVCYGFGLYFIGFPAVGTRMGLLFSFVLLANVCLLAVAWFERMSWLVALAAAGTAVLLSKWGAEIFVPAMAPTTMGVCLGFCAFFLATYFAARRFDRRSEEIAWSAIAMPFVAFGFALFFLGYREICADHVGWFYGFVLSATLILFVLAWFEERPRLVAAAAIAVAVVQVGWLGKIFTAGLAPTAMGVCLGFCVLFLAMFFVARRFQRGATEITWSTAGLALLAFCFALFFIGHAEVAARPGLLFTFILLTDLCLLALAWFDEESPQLHLVAGLAVFGLLAVWTGSRLTVEFLPWALGVYLLHAVLHTAFPLLLECHRAAAAPTWWSQLFPPLALVLMLFPLFKLEGLSVIFWPCVLLVDLLAIGLAVITASIAAVGVVLVLTLVATGAWIFHLPATMSVGPAMILVVGGFAVLFFGAGIFLVRRLGDRMSGIASVLPATFGGVQAQIPAFSALLPFLLLIMMTARLALANPSPIFGLALLLTVLALGLSVILTLEWLPACALAGVVGLEYSWRARGFSVESAALPLVWYIVFYLGFTAFPFVFRRRFAGTTGPWAVAALTGVAQFPLVYRLVVAAWPTDFPGGVPVLFAIAPLAGLFALLRGTTVSERARLNQLAFFGGVKLFFITLVFPIQFERQWLTLGWALEGAALLWLYHRVPHAGLRVVGAVLLVTAFARLGLNPAVFRYHARSDTAIFNWYLYSFGTVTGCLFAGAHLLAPPRDRVFGINGPALFNSLGTILAFLLVNIEIADFFSEPGQRVLTFQFSGHFGRDMSYTIAWALFALGLLLMGIWKETRAGRYAAIALLSVALLKLFFHDLVQLGALYRIGALFAVAVIATLASFAYQRFLPADEKSAPPKP